MKIRNIFSTIVTVCGATILQACIALPDTSDYAAASHSLHSAVVSAGEVTRAEMNSAVEILGRDDSTSTETLRDHADDFEKHWNSAESATEAMAAYADSINAITSVDETSQQSLNSMVTSLTSLSESVGIPLAGELTGTTLEVVQEVVRQIGRVRAAKNLEEALEASDPLVTRLIGRLDEQLTAASDAFILTSAIRGSRVRERRQIGASWDELQEEIEAQTNSYNAALQELNEAAGQLERGQRQAAVSDARADLEMLQARQELIRTAYDEYAADRDAYVEIFTNGVATFDAAREALQTWRASHSRLVIAVRERRDFTAESLFESVGRLRGALEEAQEAIGLAPLRTASEQQ